MSNIVKYRGQPLVRAEPPRNYPVVVQAQPQLPAAPPPGQVVERIYYVQAPAAQPEYHPAPVARPQPAPSRSHVTSDMSLVIAFGIAIVVMLIGLVTFKEPWIAPAIALGVVLFWMVGALAKFLRGDF